MVKIISKLKKIVLVVGILSLVIPPLAVAMNELGDLEMSLLTRRRASTAPAPENGDSKAQTQTQAQPQFHSTYDPDDEEWFCGNYGPGPYCFAVGIVIYGVCMLLKNGLS